MSCHDDNRPGCFWGALESVADTATKLYVFGFVLVVIFVIWCALRG